MLFANSCERDIPQKEILFTFEVWMKLRAAIFFRGSSTERKSTKRKKEENGKGSRAPIPIDKQNSKLGKEIRMEKIVWYKVG